MHHIDTNLFFIYFLFKKSYLTWLKPPLHSLVSPSKDTVHQSWPCSWNKRLGIMGDRQGVGDGREMLNPLPAATSLQSSPTTVTQNRSEPQRLCKQPSHLLCRTWGNKRAPFTTMLTNMHTEVSQKVDLFCCGGRAQLISPIATPTLAVHFYISTYITGRYMQWKHWGLVIVLNVH